MTQSVHGGGEGLVNVLNDAPRVFAELLGDPDIARRLEERVDIDDTFACEVLRDGLGKAITALRAMRRLPGEAVKHLEHEQHAAHLHAVVGSVAAIGAQIDDLPDVAADTIKENTAKHLSTFDAQQRTLDKEDIEQREPLPKRSMRFLTDYFDGAAGLDQLTTAHAGKLARAIAEQYVRSSKTKQTSEDITLKLERYLLGASNYEIAMDYPEQNASAIQVARSFTFRTVKSRIGSAGLNLILENVLGNTDRTIPDSAFGNPEYVEAEERAQQLHVRTGNMASILVQLDGVPDEGSSKDTVVVLADQMDSAAKVEDAQAEVSTDHSRLPDRTIKYMVKYFEDEERASQLAIEHTGELAREIANEYVQIIRSKQSVKDIADKLERYMHGASDKEIAEVFGMTPGAVCVMRATVYKVVKTRLGVGGLSEILDTVLAHANTEVDNGSDLHIPFEEPAEVVQRHVDVPQPVSATPGDIKPTGLEYPFENIEALLKKAANVRKAEGVNILEIDDNVVFGIASLLEYPGISVDTTAAKAWLREISQRYTLLPSADNGLDKRHIRTFRHVTLDFGNTSLATAKDAFRRHYREGEYTVRGDLIEVLQALFEKIHNDTDSALQTSAKKSSEVQPSF